MSGMKWVLRLAVVAAICSAMGSVAMAAGRPSGGGTRPTFSSLCMAFDRNRDGMLAQGEVPANVWTRLKPADANNDNVVTQAEFVAKGGLP